MADYESDLSSTESSDEGPLSSLDGLVVLKNIYNLQVLVYEMMNAPTVKKRDKFIFDMQCFLAQWRQDIENCEKKQMQMRAEQSKPGFWSRLFGGGASKANLPAVSSSSMSKWSISFEVNGDQMAKADTVDAVDNKSSATTSCREILTTPIDGESDGQEELSLHLNTCQYLASPNDQSPVSQVSHRSVTLNSDQGKEESDLRTSQCASVSLKSTVHTVELDEDEWEDGNAEKTTKARELLKKVTAMFGDSEEDNDEDVLFHHGQLGHKNEEPSMPAAIKKNAGESGSLGFMGRIIQMFTRSKSCSK